MSNTCFCSTLQKIAKISIANLEWIPDRDIQH